MHLAVSLQLTHNPPMKKLALSLCLLALLAGHCQADEANATAASAAQPSAPSVPRSEPDRNLTRLTSLLEQPHTGVEVIQLDTGKEGEKMVGVYQVEGSGTPLGGIIMFPDSQTHMDWPDNLSHLRAELSDVGWYTLSIFLPGESLKPLPKRTLPVLTMINPASAAAPSSENSDTSTAEETAPQTTEANGEANTAATSSSGEAEMMTPKEAYSETINRLGKTALEYLQKQDKLNRFIVLGIGSGATWAAQFIEQNQDLPGLNLVMIDARSPVDEKAPDLMKLLPEIKTTVIDLYHAAPVSAHTAIPAHKQRMRLARHKRLNNYHQSRLPAVSENRKKNKLWLSKQVRGRINTYIVKRHTSPEDQELMQVESMKEKGPG